MTARRYKVEIPGLGAVFFCREDESLLHAIRRAGAAPGLIGCFGGGCGRCKVRLLQGQVVTGPMSRAHISEADEAAGIFLACRVYPRGPLQLALYLPQAEG